MGQRFRYIADDALRPKDPEDFPECQVCERPATTYPYNHDVCLPDGEFADISAVCESCLRSDLDVRWDGMFHDTVRRYFEERAGVDPGKLVAEALNRLRHSPQPMLTMQGFDWPLCCGDFCEFIGSPADVDEFAKLRESASFWNRRPQPIYMSRNFAVEGPPEDWEEVSFFRCLTCEKRHFIDQYT